MLYKPLNFKSLQKPSAFLGLKEHGMQPHKFLTDEKLSKFTENNRKTRLLHILIFFGHCLNTVWVHSDSNQIFIMVLAFAFILFGALWLHKE
jgi:hypothetical protein